MGQRETPYRRAPGRSARIQRKVASVQDAGRNAFSTGSVLCVARIKLILLFPPPKPYAGVMTNNPNTDRTRPIISHCSPESLIETLYIPETASTCLAVHTPDGRTRLATQHTLETGEQLTPYSADNNLIITGCVLLPSAFEPFADKEGLVADIRAFIRRYVDISEPFEAIAAHYVLLSWVHDAFEELGYLRFRGDFGTGKTRALLVIGSLCYKPFFASGASTVSPIFHVLEAFNPTLVLDEADLRASDATADLTKILNNGTVAGLPVLRTMTNRHRELNPQAFRVFGPKLVGMRGRYQDPALESRFITEETTRRPLPPHIPIHLPSAMRREAAVLRNRLLGWRFAARFWVGPDPSRLMPGVSPRLNQTALALLSIVDEAGVRDAIADALVTDEARGLEERASNAEMTVLRALVEAFAETPTPSVAVGDLAKRVSRISPERFYLPPTSKWIGWVLRDRLGLMTTKSRGVYVVPQSERPKIERLAASLALSTERAAA